MGKKKAAKSPSEIIGLLKKDVEIICRRPRLGKPHSTRLARAQAYLSSARHPSRYTRNYHAFILDVLKNCDSATLFLCCACIRMDWMYAIHLQDIPLLFQRLGEAKPVEPLQLARLTEYGEAIVPNAQAAEMTEPAVASMPDRPTEIEGATDAELDLALTPEPVAVRMPSQVAKNVTERILHAKWSRRGIAACFGDKFVQATECCEERSITLTFPKQAHIGCFIHFNLDLTATKRLVRALTGVLLHWMAEGPFPTDADCNVMIVAGEQVRWPTVACRAIVDALGSKTLEYVNAAPGRRIEVQSGMQLHTSGVRVSTTKEKGELSIGTSVRAGQEIHSILQTSA